MEKLFALPVAEYIENYIDALAYHLEGMTNTQIARLLNIDQSNICRWINGKTDPTTSHRLFDLHPSPELAWLTGFLIGDGNIERRPVHQHTREHPSWQYRVRTAMGDKELIEYSADVVFNLSGVRPKIKCIPPRDVLHHNKWGWGFKSRQFYEYLLPYWLERNVNTFEYVFTSCASDFLRGIHDAEGSVCYYIDERNSLHKYIELVNTDSNLLNLCQSLLSNLRITSKVYPRADGSHHLTILKETDIRSFQKTVNFASQSKRLKLASLVTMMDNRKASL